MAEKVVIKHIGTPRHSGRYPWGSGDSPYQNADSFLGHVSTLRNQGLSEIEIARGMGMNTAELRARKHIAKTEKRAADAAMALRLKDKGYSNVAIGQRMGINESSVRSLLDPALRERANITTNTANALKDGMKDGEYLDVGIGTEFHMGINRTKLNNAVAILEAEGYVIETIKVRQLGTDKYTNVKVLAPPGTTLSDISRNRDNIKVLDHYTEDGGRSFLGLEPIRHLDSKTVLIRYDEDGGNLKDGVIELRPGVEHLSLGDNHYAQVRIGVDGTHFMKGMAVYGEKFPSGVDVIYNTTKPRGTAKEDVFKSVKDDVDNEFGSTVRQQHYIDANGKLQLSALNMVGSVPGAGEEGSWSGWSRNLSSQILSKQTPKLAKDQLDISFNMKKEEFDEIMSLTNPGVRKALLQTFSDEADAAAVHLKAAALPRQATQVLLPVNSMKDTEVYAPTFRDGEVVVLFRHPHGGVFEAASLRVNNKNPEAIKLMGKDAKDAVGINNTVARKLSGADFDGDTVIAIPNNKKVLKTAPSLAALKDFDPKTMYKEYDGMKVMSSRTKQMEMGKVSNLITDMTIKGANHDEIARAVKHSMVVIDAEKHKLNYKQSYIDNGISDLKEKYQGGSQSGASTLISRAGSTVRIPHRREGSTVIDPVTGKKKRLYTDPKTGRKLYEDTGETYTDRTGKTVTRLSKVKTMELETNARRLSSGTRIEEIYAEHANRLKKLANTARLRMISTKDIPYSRSAAKAYQKEVVSLRNKVALAFKNKPLERQAQLFANKIVAMKKKETPDMDEATLKKVKGQALEEARARVGAKKALVVISDKEWHAIQSGAISPSALSKILKNTDVDALKQRALPRESKGLSPARSARARAMLDQGNTRAEVADALGVSVSALDQALEE